MMCSTRLEMYDGIKEAAKREERQRMMRALAYRTIRLLPFGEEVRVYEIETDSYWILSKDSDEKLVWRKDVSKVGGNGNGGE